LQNIVESELAIGVQKHNPISASCIMVRPRTGEILAMATLPNFDPNDPGRYPMDALRNRVISDTAEPGSTFKIVVVTAGLNEHVVSLNDVFDCEHGHFAFAGRVLHDHEPFGMLSVENIITKSSNIGAAKIGIRLGQDKLYEYIKKFGFGRRTSIPLPAEREGIVYPTKVWSKVSIAQIPMGQGVTVTPLQTVMAMSAIANQGLLMRPMLVKRLEDPDGKLVARYEPQPVRQLASLDTISKMVTALKTVVTHDGTAVQGGLEHYTVAGKTGTAEKVEHGQYVHKYFSSFIGFFPADNPELCISVVMDEPRDSHYGGLVAAPVFHAIAERAANYLNLKPDILPEPSLNPEMNAASEQDAAVRIVKK
jgi:cell division protein FtsI/penicillin-binding protein 2